MMAKRKQVVEWLEEKGYKLAVDCSTTSSAYPGVQIWRDKHRLGVVVVTDDKGDATVYEENQDGYGQ
jgi:hypothetical protein